MSTPIIGAVLAVLLIVIVSASMRGRRVDGTAERPTAAGQQSAIIVLVLVIAAGLVLYFVFARR